MTLDGTTTFDRDQLLDEVVTAYLKAAYAGHASITAIRSP